MYPVTLLLFWPLLSARAEIWLIPDRMAFRVNGFEVASSFNRVSAEGGSAGLRQLDAPSNSRLWNPPTIGIFKVEINCVLYCELVVPSETKAELKYKFVPDESVDMKWKVSEELSEICRLRLKYHGDIDYTSDLEHHRKVGFRVILKPRHNNSYVECILNCWDDLFSFRVRVHLLQEREHVGDVIRVNGLAIRTNGDIVRYNYTGAVPTVSCPHTPLAGEKSFSEHRNGLFSTVCSIGGKNTTVQMFKDIPRNGLNIDGLLDHKIIFQRYYDRNESKRIIYYEYTDEDVIPLNASYGLERSEVDWKINSIPNKKSHGREELNLSECRMKKDRSWEVTFMKEKRETVVVFLYVGVCSTKSPGVTISSSPAVVPLGGSLSTLGAAAIGAVVGAVVCASLPALALGMRRRCTKPPPQPPLALPAQEQNTYDYVYSHFPKRWRNRDGTVRGTARTPHSAASQRNETGQPTPNSAMRTH